MRSGVAAVVLMLLASVLPWPTLPGETPPAETVRDAPDAPWPTFHGDPARTGNSTEWGPGTNRLLWSNSTGQNCYGSPVVAGGRVYIGSTNGSLFCFNATTGERLWLFPTGDRIHSTPWVDPGEDRIYIGSHDEYVYCLNATDGKQVWRARLGGVISSSPLVHDGKVYIGCGDWYYGPADGSLYCLYAGNGTQAWRIADAGGASSPALSDGRLFSIGDNRIRCIDPDSGSELWSNTTGGEGFGSPSVAEGRVYYASMNGDIRCFNASTGERLWLTASGYRESQSTPAVSNGSVYVGAEGGDLLPGALLKLDAANGGIAWTYALPSTPWSSPAVAGDRVYFTNDLTIECAKTGDHSQVWSYTGADGDTYGIGGSPAIAAGRLYIGGAEAKLYCFGAAEPNRPPAAPVLSPAHTIRTDSVCLNWTRSAETDFERYEVHQSLLPGFVPGPATRVLNLTYSSTNYANLSHLNYSTKYHFKVRVWDNGDPPMFNDSNEVEATTATPNGAPAAVTLYPPSAITPFSMVVSWSRNGDSDFARYELHRGTMKGFQPAVPSTLVRSISDRLENSTLVEGLKPWTTYFFKLRVYDNGSPPLRNDSAEMEARTGNTPPAAVVLAPPQMGATSAFLTWSVSPDEDFARYELHLSQNATFVPGRDTLATCITERYSADFTLDNLELARTYHFVVRTVDEEGLWNDSAPAGGTTQNTVPNAVIFSPTDGDVYDTRTPVTFDGSRSSDRDRDALSFYWTSNVDGFLSTCMTFTRLLSEGSHRITLYVRDEGGHNVSSRVSLLVNKALDRPPSIAVLSPAESEELFGTVTLRGTASDPDGDETLQGIEVKVGKSPWEEAAGTTGWSFEWNTSRVANGKCRLLFRAFDGELYSTETAVNVRVSNPIINRKPTVAITGPSAGRPFSGTMTISGTASDSDGKVTQVEMSLNGGGWFTVGGTGFWSYDLDTTSLRDGNHSLQVRSFDGTDYSEPATLNFTVKNAAPAAAGGLNPLVPGAIGLAVVAGAIAAFLMRMRRRGGAVPNPPGGTIAGK